MTCIKCGKEIPDGELFCPECSLNPTASLLDKDRPGERYPAPKGRMQTPVPVKRAAPQPMGPMPSDRKRGGSRGLKIALTVVSLLLAAAVGVAAWQYGDFLYQRDRLQTKEADLIVREKELESLNTQIEELTSQLDAANTIIADRDLMIQDLQDQLHDSQTEAVSAAAVQDEMDQLLEENQTLRDLVKDLEDQINTLLQTQ